MLFNSPHFTRRMAGSLLTLTLLAASACAGDVAEDEVEPAIDPEPAVVTDEGVAQTAYFTDWDLDDDTYLTEDEFATGWRELTLWEDWDVDRDTYLSRDEFDTGFRDRGWYDDSLYGDWDVNDDELLGEDEFTTGLYGAWDVDDDDRLAETEFDMGLFN